MNKKRKSISKRIRFDVFKRDNFTCQYCGKQAPNIILEVDHIKPVSKGGNNGMLNLITSCFDCNRGKSNKELKDNQSLSKELKQLELLSERKKQIEMMFKWKNELLKQDEMIISKINDYIYELSGSYLNENGLGYAKKWVKKYTLQEVLEGIKESFKVYEDFQTSILKTSNIISIMKLQKKKPYMKELFYIRGIIRQKSDSYYYDNKKALNRLVDLYENYGLSLEEIKSKVLTFYIWNDFTDWYYEYNKELYK